MILGNICHKMLFLIVLCFVFVFCCCFFLTVLIPRKDLLQDNTPYLDKPTKKRESWGEYALLPSMIISGYKTWKAALDTCLNCFSSFKFYYYCQEHGLKPNHQFYCLLWYHRGLLLWKILIFPQKLETHSSLKKKKSVHNHIYICVCVCYVCTAELCYFSQEVFNYDTYQTEIVS